LELFREGAVSLGLAAELCGVPQAEFMQFAAEREVALHYSLDDLEQDRQFIESLSS
jgi:predicted HTH domain antitoxin